MAIIAYTIYGWGLGRDGTTVSVLDGYTARLETLHPFQTSNTERPNCRVREPCKFTSRDGIHSGEYIRSTYISGHTRINLFNLGRNLHIYGYYQLVSETRPAINLRTDRIHQVNRRGLFDLLVKRGVVSRRRVRSSRVLSGLGYVRARVEKGDRVVDTFASVLSGSIVTSVCRFVSLT